MLLSNLFAAAPAGNPDYNLDIDAPLVHYNNLQQPLQREHMQHVTRIYEVADGRQLCSAAEPDVNMYCMLL
jgi:hypothetical protein